MLAFVSPEAFRLACLARSQRGPVSTCPLLDHHNPLTYPLFPACPPLLCHRLPYFTFLSYEHRIIAPLACVVHRHSLLIIPRCIWPVLTPFGQPYHFFGTLPLPILTLQLPNPCDLLARATRARHLAALASEYTGLDIIVSAYCIGASRRPPTRLSRGSSQSTEPAPSTLHPTDLIGSLSHHIR